MADVVRTWSLIVVTDQVCLSSHAVVEKKQYPIVVSVVFSAFERLAV